MEVWPKYQALVVVKITFIVYLIKALSFKGFVLAWETSKIEMSCMA
jgi:hypothetical protein